LEWTASKSQNWVSLSATSGSLAAGASTSVTVSINTNADSLTAGNYSDSVSFADTSNPDGLHSRAVTLRVATAPVFTLYSFTEAGSFKMVIEGIAGTEVVIEASTDLVHWSSIVTNQLSPDGTLTFSDPGSTNLPTRLYRARATP
jgi:hypothetical protein